MEWLNVCFLKISAEKTSLSCNPTICNTAYLTRVKEFKVYIVTKFKKEEILINYSIKAHTWTQSLDLLFTSA